MKSRLLVVDDDPGIRQVLEIHLAAAGFDVVLAGSLREGLECLGGSAVDMAICDMRLPDMDGMDVLTAIRELRPDLPITVISGFLDDAAAEEMKNMDAVYFIKKPFTKETLLDLVNRLFPSGELLPGNV